MNADPRTLRGPRTSCKLALAVTLMSILGTAPALAQRWARTYLRSGYGYTREVVATEDAGAIFIASGGTYNAELTRVDANGDVVWSQSYRNAGDNVYVSFYDLEWSRDGNLFIAAGYDRRPRLIKADPATGLPLWEMQGSMENGVYLGCTPTADGGCALTGWIEDANTDLMVTKVDAAGAIEWQYRYGAQPGFDIGYDLVTTDDGGYVVAGLSDVFDSGNRDLWLLRLESNGVPRWQRRVGVPGDEGRGVIDIAKRAGGGFYVSAGETYHGDNDDDVWLLHVAENGSIVWERQFDHGEDVAGGLLATPDGGCVLVGTATSPDGSNGDLWTMKLDLDGDVEWEHRIGGSRYDHGSAVAAAPDGGYFMAGRDQSQPGLGSTLLLRVGERGEIGIRSPYFKAIQGTGFFVNTPDFPTGTKFVVHPDDSSPAASDVTSIRQTQHLVAATIQAPWEDLGHAMSGHRGAPYYTAVGRLAPGEFVSSQLTYAREVSTGLLVIGTDRIDAPLLGGVLVPLPLRILIIPTGAEGIVELPGRWPDDTPAGVPILAQWFVVDADGPQGFAASNALRSVTE